MNMIRAIIFLLLHCALFAAAQNVNTPVFRAVSPPEGFTYSAVVTITEDPQGMIWFGTQHGLYSYDTEKFHKFLHRADNPNTPSGNNIRNLFCDSSGKMWISTSAGLCYYDFTLEQFVRCRYADEEGARVNRNVWQVFEDKSKQIWMIDQHGLAKVDTISKTFSYSHFNPAPTGLRYARVAADASLWLGTSSGSIYQSPFPYDTLMFFGRFRNGVVQSILPVRNEVWIGYDWDGADKVGYDGKLKAHYNNPSEENIIANSRVRDIYEDRAGRIWLATYKGLSIINGSEIINYDTENYPGINHSSLFVIYEDSHGGLWVGTWSGGLYYLNMHDNHFIHVRDIYHPNQNTNVISSFTDGQDNTVWVGTESGLLFSYDINNKQYTSHNFIDGENLLKSIKSLYTDTKGNVWIGTFTGGIWIKAPGDREFRQLDYMKTRTAQIYTFAEDGPKMWIGSGNTGVHSYNMENGKTEQYTSRLSDPNSLSNNLVRSLLVDSRGNLWAGTMYGLNFKSANQDIFKRFFVNPEGNTSTINHNEIFTLHEDRQGNIWIGTGGGGLNKYDPNTGSFEYISQDQGLAGNEVHGILEDNNGNIWVSTENGISLYDPRNKTIRNFVKEDGLQGNQFNPGASFRSKTGWMYFGGSNGFTCFSPSLIRSNPVPPLTLITSIAVNHEELKPGVQGSALKKSIKYTDDITLQARQNSLTISFIANNYLQPQKNRFRYRLVNYDESWIEAGSERKARFTKIRPGKYIFEVISSNNDGVWNLEPKRLYITIKQPIFLQWYAVTAYFILALLLLYFTQREIDIRQRLRMEIRDERLRRENEEKLSQMKMRFMTNITHEFKTPLSLILSPADNLLKKFGHDSDARFLLEILKRNTLRLQWLISQIIDLRKIDMNKLDAVNKPTNVVKLCHRISEYFMADARDRNIQLTVNTGLTEIYLLTDPDKLDIIITNLVSNAMKFTPEGGSVTISIEQIIHGCKDNFNWACGNPMESLAVQIKVSDTGAGMEISEIPLMFERFTQGKGHEIMGTGIGLSVVKEYVKLLGGYIGVQSAPSEGTSFTICFPWVENINQHEEKLSIQGMPSKKMEENPENINDPDFSDESITILLVEDDADTRNYIASLLKKHFRIITASNGNQGYEKAVVTIPDIIISDVVMPGTGGFEMNKLLKENNLTSEIPIIMITAQDNPEIEIESIESGAYAYLTKPFSEELLIAHLRKVISDIHQRKTSLAGQGMGKVADEPEFSDHQLVDKAIRIIEQNMMRIDFGVDKLAGDLNMSRTSLYRKLKSMTGQSATEFIRYTRLKKAITLMEGGMLSIEEVSMAVGFNSHSYFSHCFRQHFGKTPSEFLLDKK